jgi:pentatricopeptide repeat protein
MLTSRLLKAVVRLMSLWVVALLTCVQNVGAWRMLVESFNNMPSWIAVSWAAMIFGHVKCGEGQKVLQVYQQMEMQQEGVQPDPATFIRVLNACASVFSLQGGQCILQLHRRERGFKE